MNNLAASLENLGVKLPYSIEAEQAVLGAVILNSDLLPALIEKLSTEHFYSVQNGGIYECFVRLFSIGTSIDFVTILNEVTSSAVFESKEAAKAYLTSIAETVPTLSNIGAYADIVLQKYTTRRLMGAATDILEKSEEETDSDLLLEYAEQKIYDVRKGKDNNAMQPISSAIIDTFAHLQRLAGPDRLKYLGVPTGFVYLDSMLTGMGKSDLIILAARPGMGKTSFALNIASNVARRQNVAVAIFSLEMSKEQLTQRLLSSEAMLDSHLFRTGKLTPDNWQNLARVSDGLAKEPIYLDDSSGITVPEIKAKVRRINSDPAKPQIGLIVIDYLQLMTSGKPSQNRVQEISEMTRNLKIMAKELNVPIITLSQLSRNTDRNTKTDHRPVLSDLRDSGSIEQDADVVLFLYREAYYSNNEEDTDTTTAECIVAKNRHGDVGKIDLAWDGAHTRFMDIDYTHD